MSDIIRKQYFVGVREINIRLLRMKKLICYHKNNHIIIFNSKYSNLLVNFLFQTVQTTTLVLNHFLTLIS